MCIERKAKRQREEFINSRFLSDISLLLSAKKATFARRTEKSRRPGKKSEWAVTSTKPSVVLATISKLRSLTLSIGFHFLRWAWTIGKRSDLSNLPEKEFRHLGLHIFDFVSLTRRLGQLKKFVVEVGWKSSFYNASELTSKEKRKWAIFACVNSTFVPFTILIVYYFSSYPLALITIKCWWKIVEIFMGQIDNFHFHRWIENLAGRCSQAGCSDEDCLLKASSSERNSVITITFLQIENISNESHLHELWSCFAMSFDKMLNPHLRI